jgi:penicillin V acylase-like amidase (Ntn superfamily)
VPTSRVVVANYAYEFVAFCTSIVAKQMDGKILHMRLLDFFDVDNTKNMTYIAEFYRNNTFLYKAVMTGGSPLIPTGYKEGKFSISLNSRYHNITDLETRKT